jgi:hypothetical protein
MRGDFDEDELDDDDDGWFDDEPEHLCECGSAGCIDACNVCGAPMCSACFEMGCGVCRKC